VRKILLGIADERSWSQLGLARPHCVRNELDFFGLESAAISTSLAQLNGSN